MCQFEGRIVAATNRNLAEEVRAARFREDLLYRLDVFSVRLPPLREHPADLSDIADALLSRLSEKYGRPKPGLREQDLLTLQAYRFPGNVRELRNLLERSLLRTDPGAQELTIDLEWLGSSAGSPSPPVAAGVPPMAAQPGHPLTAIEQQEYDLIARALASENGGIRRAAARLGLTHQALLRRLQKWPELRQAGNLSQ